MRRPQARDAALLVGIAAAALGLASEDVAYGWRDPERWVPDLLVGWTLLATGTIAWIRRPSSRTGSLLTAAGVAWFAPNFAFVAVEPIAWLAAHSVALHWGPTLQAVLTYPTGRIASNVERVVVIAGYAVAIGSTFVGDQGVDLVTQAALGAAVIGAAIWRTLTAFGPTRRARAWAVPAATALGLGMVGVAMMRLAGPDRALVDATLSAYQVALCGVAIWLLVGLLREPWRRSTVTDLVVELGDAPTASVRDALALALSDPTLDVGYAIEGTAGYVDADGRAIDVPAPGGGRVVTPVAIDARTVGVIIHDPAVLDDPGLLPSIGDATRLAAANARLQAQVRSQIADVEASRRRLVEAEDDARQRIQAQLAEGTEARLRVVAGTLAEARALAQDGASATTVEQTTRAAWQVERALDDLHELSRGLHPPVLHAAGLQDALLELARTAPIPCSVEVDVEHLPPRFEAATWFVCSEALANVSKHARATRASIQVTVDHGRLVIEVADDGAGGADPGGSGLRGLADRLEAFGGRLTIDSRAGLGTRLTAELSLDVEA